MNSSNGNAPKYCADAIPTFTAPGRYETRLQLGGYFADIVTDPEQHPPIHHCIVQRVGSAQVLYLGQESSLAAALECGHRHLEELAAARREKHCAIYEFATRALK
jgi:hypothetical protein